MVGPARPIFKLPEEAVYLFFFLLLYMMLERLNENFIRIGIHSNSTKHKSDDLFAKLYKRKL